MLTKLDVRVYEMDHILRTPDLLSKIRSLTLNSYSGMNKALNAFQEEMQFRSIRAKAITGYFFNDMICWALFAQDEKADIHAFNGEGICFQLYVLPTFRRRGFGTQLLSVATVLAGQEKLKVYDDNSPEFFHRHRTNILMESIYDSSSS